MLMLKADYAFDAINLADYAKSPNDLARLKGRIIGLDGKARKTIEELTETSICVYGKTASVIGEVSRISFARRAIEMLLAGSQHANVYAWLEKQRHRIREADAAGEGG
jgi:ribosomal RNA assembly protein